jgi:hypothetical protein
LLHSIDEDLYVEVGSALGECLETFLVAIVDAADVADGDLERHGRRGGPCGGLPDHQHWHA